ncbi:aminotransferase [Nitzschia inconspicua]|uniref:Aminotransferase n=1 Tax=Nitzschia inconspicua TaxID=303405 RepID=A0A9K3PNS9_9STRA|nr:aminotransferase [Nitzschia inconspicua]
MFQSTALLAVICICITQSWSSAFQPSSRKQCLSRPGATKESQLRTLVQSVPRQSGDDSTSASSSADDGITFSPGEATIRLGLSTGPTVWTEFGRIAQEFDPVNLGQGFPDWLPPKFAVDSLVEAVLDSAQSPHQYTRPAGHPNLVQQLARRYSIHMKRDIHPMDEIAVTVGASQALYLSLQTLIKPGDEVVLFEPFFDLYVNQVRLAGGTPVFVPLYFEPYDDQIEGVVSGGEWKLDRRELMKVVSPKTKAIILNSPHNPTGKVFTRSEMETIAESLDLAGPACVVLSDEVYKYIVHAPPKEQFTSDSPLCAGHTHFASLPGMWDRTITISSAGKTFSATGWQVGWCIGPRRLIGPIHQLLPYVQFCASTVIQEALARSLPRADEPYEGHPSYYEYLKDKYTKKRDLLVNALTNAGFAVPDYQRTPGGGFFIFARAGNAIVDLIPPKYLMAKNPAAPGGVARQDWALCQWMAEEIGLLCIPSSPFFSMVKAEEGASDSFIRVAFCKNDETIEAAAKALERLKTMEVGAGKSSNATIASTGDVK